MQHLIYGQGLMSHIFQKQKQVATLQTRVTEPRISSFPLILGNPSEGGGVDTWMLSSTTIPPPCGITNNHTYSQIPEWGHISQLLEQKFFEGGMV